MYTDTLRPNDMYTLRPLKLRPNVMYIETLCDQRVSDHWDVNLDATGAEWGVAARRTYWMLQRPIQSARDVQSASGVHIRMLGGLAAKLAAT